jgi:hypothetical protein
MCTFLLQMLYNCSRCGFQTNLKQSLIRHLQKKIPCPEILSNVCIKDILCGLKKSPTSMQCKFCNKSFSSNSNKHRHQKICTSADENSLEIEKLIKKVSTLEKHIGSTVIQNQNDDSLIHTHIKTQNNTQNNTQNITNSHNKIVINAFYNTDTSNISQDLIKKCLHSCNIVPLIENVFFNPESPENHNVRIANQKKKTLTVFDGEEWQPKDKTQVTCQMINQFGFKIILKFFIENYEDKFGDYRIQDPDVRQLYRPIEEEQDIEEQEEEMREIKEWMEEIENIKHRPRLLDKISDDVFTVAVRNRLYVCQKV